MFIEPVTLEGAFVRLEPLSLERHAEGLVAVGLDPDLWRWATARIETAADLRAYVGHALADQAAGRALPFATIERAGGRIVGSTRFMSIAVPHRRVEIGCTWIAKRWQRTAINTEAKYLMLRHAFENWGCQRVELKTDTRNQRSRQAMLRLGCVEEGVHRKHMVTGRGEVRDTVYYGVVDDDWPAVKARLEGLLGSRQPADDCPACDGPPGTRGGAGDAPGR